MAFWATGMRSRCPGRSTLFLPSRFALRRLATDPARRTGVLGELLASPLLDLVRERRRDEIDALLARIAGDGLTLDGLGVGLEERP